MGIFHRVKKAETPSSSQQPEYERFQQPEYHADLAGYAIDMRDNDTNVYTFVLSGWRVYLPNRASQNGSGSDDWFYLCKCGGEDCLLCYSIHGGFGPLWLCSYLSTAEASGLEQVSGTRWAQLSTRLDRRVLNLHPVQVEQARTIIKETHSRCGEITDRYLNG